VLELQAIVIDMPVFRLGGPYPPLARLSGELPTVLQHSAESRRKRKSPPRCFCLAFRDQKHSIPATVPVDIVPSQAVALFRAHPSIEQHKGNIMQERQGSLGRGYITTNFTAISLLAELPAATYGLYIVRMLRCR